MISIIVVILPTFFTKGVSRVTVNQEIDLSLILNDKNDEKDVKILFFGYSGCTDICTPRMLAIDEFYKTLDTKIKERIGVEFLDISAPFDKELPNEFAKFFNEEFKGIYLSLDKVRDYTKPFSVYFSKSLTDELEYDHTSHIYLVKRNGTKKELRYIYNSYPYDFEQLTIDIKELLDERK